MDPNSHTSAQPPEPASGQPSELFEPAMNHHHHHAPLEISGVDLQVRPVLMEDGTPTGSQIASACGFTPSQQVTILHWLPDGNFEDVRPEEVADIARKGRRFIVQESDSSFRLTIDGRRIDWPAARISASVVRQLSRKTDVEVILQREDVPDAVLGDATIIDLRGDGTEHFATRKRPTLVRVFYADVPFDLPRRPHTTEELLALFNVEAGYLLDLIDKGRLIELKPGQTIELKDGMHFASHPPRGQSS
jgi:hypothetical protein